MIERKTEGELYQEIKTIFEDNDGIDYNNKCNKVWISEDSLIEKKNKMVKHLESIGAHKEARAIELFVETIINNKEVN